ncbi:MAG: hypothetical protein MJ229_03270 [bacterium]|nr:hypothetical protein [bacterium]
MISNVSFGQTINMPQEQTKITQQANYVVSNQQADSYVSSKKKKTHPIAKLLVAAAAVLGGSVLATKSGKFSEAADKVAKAAKAVTENAEKVSLKDKAMSAIYNLGNKVKAIFVKNNAEVTENIKAREIKNVDDLKEYAHHPNNPELKKGFEKLMKKFGKDSANETIKAAKDTTKKVNLSLPKDATKKAMAEDMKIEKQILIDKVKKFFKGKDNADEVVKDASKISKNAKKRVKTRRVADEVKNWKTHNPNDVIILDDGKLGMSKFPIGLPTPEQVEATMAKMKK